MRIVESTTRGVGHAIRKIFRDPLFSLTVIVTLAVGVGANATMFGIVDVMLFRPFPYVKDTARLVHVRGAETYVKYLDLRERVSTLELAARTRQTLSFGVGPNASQVRAECVTPNYLSLLRVQPPLGRSFLVDNAENTAPSEVVLSHEFWRRSFGSDPKTIGGTVSVSGRQFSIVGVAPERFRGAGYSAVDLWIPLTAAPEACSFTGTNLLRSERGSWLETIGRLKDGVTLQQATNDLEAVQHGITQDAVTADGGLPGDGMSLEFIQSGRTLRSGRQGRVTLWLGAGAFVLLLLSCANVATLLSVRALDRDKEVTIRRQLGASSGQIFAQLLVEHIVLAVLSCFVAVIAAVWAAGAFNAWVPFVVPEDMLDGRSLILLIAFGLFSAFLSGVIPALQASRSQLRRDASGASLKWRDHEYFRNVLVLIQVSLAVILVVAAGLFTGSVQQFRKDLRYDLDNVLVITIDLKRSGFYQSREIFEMYQRMLERVSSLNEISAAALTSGVVLDSAGPRRVIAVKAPTGSGAPGFYTTVAVTPAYFETLGLALLSGRPFNVLDDPKSKPVAILTSTLAHRLFAGADPIGKCVLVGGACREIVGICEDTRRSGMRRTTDSDVFLPLNQLVFSSDEASPQALLVRQKQYSPATTAMVAAAVRSSSPNLPFINVRRLRDLSDTQAQSWRMGANIAGVFGVAAVLLAAFGIYGVLALSVRQKTREFGVRLALGARRSDIVGLVLRRAFLVVAVGWILGASAAILVSRYLKSILFDVAVVDPSAWVYASASIVGAAMLACFIPSIRAARIDPAVSLRTE